MLDYTKSTAEFSFKDSKQFENDIALLKDVARKHCVEPVSTPLIHTLASLEPGLGEHLKENIIYLSDVSSTVKVLRPDHTTPLAKMLSQNSPDPTKQTALYYSGSKYQRHLGSETGIAENLQFGVEIIGRSNDTTDAFCINILSEMLGKVGFPNAVIDIGHVQFAQNLSPQKKKALIDSDYVKFGEIPERTPIKKYQKKEFQKLSDALTPVIAEQIYINDGLIKKLDYYTGFIFEAYIPGFAYPIASGGRYDSLMNKFGWDCPAVGFALNMNHIVSIKGRHA
jgi:ATP phosphoribosyltransferase regulatory subunit